MKRVAAVSFMCLFLWILAVLPVFGETKELEPENLYAQSAVLMDADSGRILFEKNGKEIRPNASTTNILTCILALEKGDPDSVVEISANAAAQPQVHLGVRTGQQFYLGDLLYSLMLESHNDSAVAIAEHIAGSTEAFAELMNEKAREIGCKNSHFVSPNGLDWEDSEGTHSTTAADLALILRYCIGKSPKAEEFLAITRTPSKSFSDAGGSGSYSCVNHNAFLSMMEGALTGKTGFTGKAGYCYVGALKDGERTFVIALLACGWPNNKTYKWSDARNLFGYGLACYQYEDVARKLSMAPVPVADGVLPGQAIGEEAYVRLQEEGEESISLLLSDKDQVKMSVIVPSMLKAPVKEGETVGELTYLLNGEVIRSYPVVTLEGVGKRDYAWCFDRIFDRFLNF